MKITLGASGSAATAVRSRRSHLIVSIPWSRSERSELACENLETAMTRSRRPIASRARRAMRASVGPILPAAPSTTMSPGVDRRASSVPGEGAESASSSAASLAKVMPRSRRVAFSLCRVSLHACDHCREPDLASAEADVLHHYAHEVGWNRESGLWRLTIDRSEENREKCG